MPTDKDNEMYNLFNKIDTTYNVNADSITIPGNVNISELNIGNLQADNTLSGNINIANMYNFDTSNFTSQNITATVSLTSNGNLNVGGDINVDGDIKTKQSIYATTDFAIPIANRTTINYPGMDLENTNYLPNTDVCGNVLPFFQPKAEGFYEPQFIFGQSVVPEINNPIQWNLPEFGVFKASNGPTDTLGNQQTFQGVCDKEYVYFVWEIGESKKLVPPFNYSIKVGYDPILYDILVGYINDVNLNQSIIIKMDRITGEIVEWKPIGLIIDHGYLYNPNNSPDIGPGPYYIDPLDNKPAVDNKGEFKTTNVTGLNKKEDGYIGFQTSNIKNWETTGDDISRGPLNIYDDPELGSCLYCVGQSLKYSSVYKIRCSDLTLVWRRTVDSKYKTANTESATGAGNIMRNLLVIPPSSTFERDNPIVIGATTTNFEYAQYNIYDLSKLFNYFTSLGSLNAWEDHGKTAEKKWTTLNGPDPFKKGDTLPETVFRWAPPGTPLPSIKIGKNGTKKTKEMNNQGYIKDEDGNVSIEIYYPLKNGYIFTDGNPNSNTVAGCKTTGKFPLLTGRRYTDFQSLIYSYQNQKVQAANFTEYPPINYTSEIGYFDFTKDSYNYTICGGVFDATKKYSCKIQNGPYAGQTINFSGQDILNGIPDNKGRYFPQQNPPSYQPVVKKIYFAQVGRLLDDYEISELSIFGGGIYSNLSYDKDTDTIITPTGNWNHTCYQYEKDFNEMMLNDFWDGSNNIYPGIHSAYTDPSGVLNEFINPYGNDDTTVLVRDGKFGGLAPFFFTGMDLNLIDSIYYNPTSNPNALNPNYGKYFRYVPVSEDYFQNCPLTNLSQRAISNYFWVQTSVNSNNTDSSGNVVCIDSSGNLKPLMTKDMLGNDIYNPGCNSYLYRPGKNEKEQADFIRNRNKAFWQKIIAVRDNQNFGKYYNRSSADGFTGIKVSNGKLLFSVTLNALDVFDHSTDFDGQTISSLIGAFHGGGYNQDGASASIVKIKDSSSIEHKILACTTKSRVVILDFDKLVDSNGNGLTLTPVDGDNSITFNKGIKKNTWKESIIYESTYGLVNYILAFNGYNTDGNNLIFSQVSGFVTPSVFTGGIVPFIEGKEVHGYKFPLGSSIESTIGLNTDEIQNCYNTKNYFKIPDLIEGSLTKAFLPIAYYLYSLNIPNFNPFNFISQDGTLIGYTYLDQVNSLYNLITPLIYTMDLVEKSNSKGYIPKKTIQFMGNTLPNPLDIFCTLASSIYFYSYYIYYTNINTCYDLPKIINNFYFNKPISLIDVVKWCYGQIPNGSGISNYGASLYGSTLVIGSKNGTLTFLDVNTGYPINQPIPKKGEYVPQSIPRSLSFNPEGTLVTPLIVDGVMYGYGGTNKFTLNISEPTLASKIFMWTPYGK